MLLFVKLKHFCKYFRREICKY